MRTGLVGQADWACARGAKAAMPRMIANGNIYDSVAFFECYVLARGSTGSAATFMCEYSLQRQGTADVTLLGTGRKDKEGTSPEPELDIVATGPNVEIQITGIAGVTFDWAIFGALTVLG